MSAKKTLVSILAALGLLIGVPAPTSGAQDGGEAPPPPLAGIGYSPNIGDYPALAFVLTEYPGNVLRSCTGTLIAPTWVLTAAHCVEHENFSFAVEVTVMLGSIDGDDVFFAPGPGVEIHTVAGFLLNGNWSVDTFSDDVALLKLPVASAKKPMPIATDAALVSPANGSPLPATAIGFGQCGASCNDSLLRFGTTEIWSDSDVTSGVAIPGVPLNVQAITQQKNLFLAPNVTVGGALCSGDSGGPLIVMQNGQRRVAGVNSFIVDVPSANDCEGGPDNQYFNGVADIVTSDLASWVSQVTDAVSQNCWGLPATLEGTSFLDKIFGTGDADVIHGRGGGDLIVGGEGGDRLCGGAGPDAIFGEGGSDKIKGNSGSDDLVGGTGADTLDGGKGKDIAHGGGGADRLLGGGGNDDLFGGNDNDNIKGGSGNDDIFGNSGKDTLRGGNGNDTVNGGKNGDNIFGGPGKDKLTGNSGNDDIFGNSGKDTLTGSKGADDLDGGRDTDSCSGGTGSDTKTACES
jgi:hypothetical protein